MTNPYAVQAAAFSEAIHVGQLAADGAAFKDKADLTADVLYAVAQWVQQPHDGDAWVKVGGLRMDITVTPVTSNEPTEAGAAR